MKWPWLFIVALVISGVLMTWAVPQPSKLRLTCIDPEMREEIRYLVIAGIDEAFKAHTKQLFDVWMKDSDHQPERAMAGLHKSMEAYAEAKAAALAWSLPSCKSEDKK